MTVIDNLKIIMWMITWGRRVDTWEPQALSVNKDWSLNTSLNTLWKEVWIQNPIQVDGDSVYVKDIWVEQSISTNWTDEGLAWIDPILIPFTNLHTVIKNSTSDNPKILMVHFNRTVFANQIWLWCFWIWNSFSNVKIIALWSWWVERVIKDESSDNTKETSKNIFFWQQELFNAIKIEFHTIDEVCISNITIQKFSWVSLWQTERTTNSIQVMEYSHAEIHSWSHYYAWNYYPLLKDWVKDILIVTPDSDRWAHMTVAVDTVTSSVVYELFENITTSNDWTRDNERNRNRNFTDNNTTFVYEDPIITWWATLVNRLVNRYFWAWRWSAWGWARDSEEILLKPNSKYLLRATEQWNVATIINITLDWYEHINKG